MVKYEDYLPYCYQGVHVGVIIRLRRCGTVEVRIVTENKGFGAAIAYWIVHSKNVFLNSIKIFHSC